ncbi:MAG: hypothetical protein WAZ77_01800 [Candidatus Nitrosopolaris sp.]
MTLMTLVLLVREKVSKTEDGTNKFLNTGFFATYHLFIILLCYPVPDPMNTFFSSRGRLLKNFGSLVNTEPRTSLEYALRPPTSPINSGSSLPKKERTLLPFTLSGFSR